MNLGTLTYIKRPNLILVKSFNAEKFLTVDGCYLLFLLNCNECNMRTSFVANLYAFQRC